MEQLKGAFAAVCVIAILFAVYSYGKWSASSNAVATIDRSGKKLEVLPASDWISIGNPGFESDQEREQTRIQKQREKEKSNFLAKWRKLLRSDYKDGIWYVSFPAGGGFKDVNIMFYNDSDYTVDKVEVRFWVKMRSQDAVCHDKVHVFENVSPHTAQSMKVSNDCGMRPPRIGIISFKIAKLDIDITNDWDEVYRSDFHN
jgi:hypothetical protein